MLVGGRRPEMVRKYGRKTGFRTYLEPDQGRIEGDEPVEAYVQDVINLCANVDKDMTEKS